jgi:hypothetical protein
MNNEECGNMNRAFMLTLIVFSVMLGLVACDSGLMNAPDDIVGVKERHEAALMSVPGVVGVGIGDCDGQPCIKVFVKERTPELEGQIPKQLEGFKVDIETTGPIEIQPTRP